MKNLENSSYKNSGNALKNLENSSYKNRIGLYSDRDHKPTGSLSNLSRYGRMALDLDNKTGDKANNESKNYYDLIKSVGPNKDTEYGGDGTDTYGQSLLTKQNTGKKGSSSKLETSNTNNSKSQRKNGGDALDDLMTSNNNNEDNNNNNEDDYSFPKGNKSGTDNEKDWALFGNKDFKDGSQNESRI